MLGKLLKYEMRATGRIFLPTYLLLLVFALLSRFSMAAIDFDIVRKYEFLSILFFSIIGIYVFTILGAFIVTFIVLIQRFYKNLTGDEGYLMFTLPVSPWQLVASKTLSSLLWQLATGAAVLISLFVMLFDPSYLPGLKDVFHQLWIEFTMEFGVGANIVAMVVEFIIITIVGAIQGMLMIYAAIAIGHTMQNHRILGAVGAYIGLSIIMQVLGSVVMIPLGLLNFGNLETIVVQNPFLFFNGIMLVSGLISIVSSVIFFFITTFILSRQLNLE